MKKIILLILVGITVIVTLTGCKVSNGMKKVGLSKEVKKIEKKLDSSKTYDINIKGLSIVQKGNNDNVKVKIVSSNKSKVKISYNKDFEDYGFKLDVDEKDISIRAKDDYQYNPSNLSIVIYTKFKNIKLRGGFPLDIDTKDIPKLKVDIDGVVNGNITNLDTSDIKVKIEGVGKLNLSGKTDISDFKIDGAGYIKAKNLISNKAKVNINGAGRAEISAVEKLDTRLVGAGLVRFYGDPIVKKNNTGATKVEQASKDIY